MLGQLVTGMNEVRESLSGLVSRADLKDLVQQQRQEMHTYVAAVEDKVTKEIEEVKATTASKDEFTEMKAKYESLILRVEELEKRDGTGSKTTSDPANFQIAFRGFTVETENVRTEALLSFMQYKFPTEQVQHIDHKKSGPWNAKKLEDTSFVQFYARDARDRVMTALRKESGVEKGAVNVSVPRGDGSISVAADRARTRWIRGRNWAMRKAEEEIHKHVRGLGAVKYTASKDERKITVDGVNAFVQKRGDEYGTFVGAFAALKLK